MQSVRKRNILLQKNGGTVPRGFGLFDFAFDASRLALLDLFGQRLRVRVLLGAQLRVAENTRNRDTNQCTCVHENTMVVKQNQQLETDGSIRTSERRKHVKRSIEAEESAHLCAVAEFRHALRGRHDGGDERIRHGGRRSR